MRGIKPFSRANRYDEENIDMAVSRPVEGNIEKNLEYDGTLHRRCQIMPSGQKRIKRLPHPFTQMGSI